MTDLEKVTEWIKTFPQYDRLTGFSVDYTDRLPNNGGIFPSGIAEISRTEDIVGNVYIMNQYNFGLYYVFLKDPGDNDGSKANADWVMDFQKWVQEQSAAHKAPTFGDYPSRETAKAQNGMLYQADEEGTAMYMVQLSFTAYKHYEVI